jgi:ABC-type xylose transport system permease subunit
MLNFRSKPFSQTQLLKTKKRSRKSLHFLIYFNMFVFSKTILTYKFMQQYKVKPNSFEPFRTWMQGILLFTYILMFLYLIATIGVGEVILIMLVVFIVAIFLVFAENLGRNFCFINSEII